MRYATDGATMIRERAASLAERYATGHEHPTPWSADCLACAFRAGREWQLLRESMHDHASYEAGV